MPATHLASFRVDATVPLGHGLCGGWIKPAAKVDSPLLCLGVVLLGSEAPVILATVDWTGVCNEAHTLFTDVLARAAHTTPERVALHAVHQHNAPFVDVTAQKLIHEHKDLPACCDLNWFAQVRRRAGDAVGAALAKTERVTHYSAGQAQVEKVASNRRILGPDGKLAGWRASACKDATLRDAPVGLIDPWLKTLAFWTGDRKLAALHWYATHPMSYYGDGVVNHDFVGIARERRTQEERVPHLYFTGCAGNVAAGKYNDGAPERRAELAERIHQAIVSSEASPQRQELKQWSWKSCPVELPERAGVIGERLHQTLNDVKPSVATRIRAAMQLAYLQRREQRTPIHLGSLDLGACRTLHLPAECFIEYQLFAQQQTRGTSLCCAAYGDGGPWYIPTAAAYPQGGYEPSASFVDPGVEEVLRKGMKTVLG